jgi:hypothetical protein
VQEREISLVVRYNNTRLLDRSEKHLFVAAPPW